MPAKPPRARRAGPRLALGALFAAALLAAAGHALLWRWACGRLEQGFSAWAEARRAEGWRVDGGAPRRGGWPFSASLAVPGVRLQGGAAALLPGGVDWQADAVTLRLSPARLDRLAVEAPGRHRLRLGDGAVLSFAADRLDATLPLEEGAAPREAAAAARGLRFDTPAGIAEVRAASLEYGTSRGQAATALRVSAADLTLPDGSPGAARLGRTVERIGLDLLLTGLVPPPLDGDPVRRAEVWRDNGGALEVKALDARWGEATASASATLALDKALRPAGTGVLRLAGGDALLDAAGEAGLLPPFGAAAARLALRALTHAPPPPPEGGPGWAELPLVLRDGSLRLGGIPLARLPPAPEWGAPGPGAVPARPTPPRN